MEMLDFVVPPPRPLPNHRTWGGDKGVGLARIRRRGRILVIAQRPS